LIQRRADKNAQLFLEKLFGVNCTVIHTREREREVPDTLKVRMVKGPAKVIVKGACHVLGSDVSWQTVKVRAGKALPFEPNNRWCRLHARLGYGARLWWANPKQAGTSMWHSFAEQMSALAAGNKKTTTVMLVGDTDTGKSTLAIYLANMAIRSGLVPSVIDGDIGQGDLAPPTAIGAAVLSKQVVDLRDVNTTRQFEFVGSISPAGFEDLIAKKLRSIHDRISPLANITIVNTDGYVRNGGVHYKAKIAEELQPDAIISLGDTDALFDTLETGPWQVMRARPSSQTYKSRLERLRRRLDQFIRYVGNGSHTANLSQVKFDYMNKLFSPSDLFQPPTMQLEPENMKGMFVGLGLNGRVVGFGVIINVNPSNSTIHTQTAINLFDTIYLSNVNLSSNRIMEVRLT
jgi:polynucleotide 5'-hydroxyl-kinase GRC3/NOL9